MRLLASVLAAAVVASLPQGAPRTVLQFGHLWDGSKLLDDVTVTVEDGKIASIEPGRPSLPAGAADMRRYTAIPGLIDLHTHITYYWDRKPGTRPLGQRRRPAVTVFLAQDNARRTLETGVTTIRDLGASGDADYAMRDLVAMGAMPGPRMFVAGQGLSAGRGWTPDPPALAKMAEDRIKAGSDWVKVYASRGSFDSVDTTQTLTFDELKAIVDASHALGHKVAIHSYGAPGVKDAVRAGADSVEHGIEIDDETFAEMVRRGTVWVPTIDHNRYYVDAKDDYGFKPEAIPPLTTREKPESARRVRRAQPVWDPTRSIRCSARNPDRLARQGRPTPAQVLATTTTAADLLGQGDRLGRRAPGCTAAVSSCPIGPRRRSRRVTGVRCDMKRVVVVTGMRLELVSDGLSQPIVI